MLLSWYFQSPNALLTRIGHPLRNSLPVDLLSALFSVGGTLVFEIFMAVPVTYRLALWKFMGELAPPFVSPVTEKLST